MKTLVKRVIAIVLCAILFVVNSEIYALAEESTGSVKLIENSDIAGNEVLVGEGNPQNSTLKIGDCISLGKYNGEAIIWRCVDIDDNGPLMMSVKSLCEKEYDAPGDYEQHSISGTSFNNIRKQYGSNCWQDSNIRQWLNTRGTVDYTHGNPSYSQENGFLSNFSTDELKCIKTVMQKTYVNELEPSREGYCDGGSTEQSDPFGTLDRYNRDYSNCYYKYLSDTFFYLNEEQIYNVFCNNPSYLNMGLNYATRCSGSSGASYEHIHFLYTQGEVVISSTTQACTSLGVCPAFYLNIPVTIEIEQPQSSIMDVVDKYTSQDSVKGLEEIINGNYSDEELKTHLYEYFCCDNLYDVKDNITKLQDSHDERWAYNGLICSDMYCASQWNSYLNSDEGILTRVALVASGLAFNGELGDWLSVSTYLDGEYPGVKKYKSLLEEYINDNKVEMEFYSYLKTGEKFVNGTAKSISSTQKANFLKGFGKTKNVAEAHTVFNDFVYENLNGFLDDETHEIRVEKKTPLMEAFGTSHTIFKMTNVTVGGIEDFVEVESNIEAYKTCKSFLDEIIAADDLPLEMRMAASQLEEEYEKEYWAPVENILNQIRDECLDEALDLAGFSNVLDLNGYLTAIEYVSFVMNQIVDVGAMVKNSAYTEGYAKLAEHWCSKIETDKANYLQNRNEENAWAFYDDYMTLWKLRVLGEKKYLKMNQLEGGKVVDGISDVVFGGNLAGVITEATGYADKEAAVNKILERLDSFKFQLDGSISVPAQYQYLQKVMVECPVDVEILSSNGSQVYILKDGVESDTTNAYGRFKTVYRPTTGDFVKIAYLYANDRYTIKAVGNKAGKVSYTIATTDDNVNCEVKGFDDVVIDKDSVIEMDTKSDDYLVDFDGDGQNIVTGKTADKSKLYVQFDFQNGSDIDVVYADENGYVTAPIPSERTGYKFKGWYTEPNGEGTCLFYYYDSIVSSNNLISESITLYACWVVSNIEWSINTVKDDVILSLTGTGSIIEGKHPWDESKDTITRIEINGNITGVEYNAFVWYSNLSSVYIGPSVKNVDPKAFSGCNSLIRFEVSDNNKSYCSIDGVLFSKDKEMLIRFPEGISGSYNVPSGTTKIGDFAFSKEPGGKESIVVGGIREVFLPNTVKLIGESAFCDCQNLTNVTMTDSVEKIGKYCFDCTGLTEIRLSNNIVEIPNHALSSSSLKTVVVSNKLQCIGSYAFGYALKTLYSNGSKIELNTVALPSTLTKVSQSAFSYSGVECIKINSSNLYFEKAAFWKCDYLKDIYVEGKITNIPEYTFNSKSIEGITLLSPVTSVGDKAFLCHDGLTINLYTSNAPTLSENTFDKFSPGMNIVINVPVNAKGYDVEPWTKFTINKVLDLKAEGPIPSKSPVPSIIPSARPKSTLEPSPTPTSQPVDPDSTDPTKRFSDVPAGKWYSKPDGPIAYVIANGIMNGTGDGSTFEPESPCTREMFVQILYNAEGAPGAGPSNPFTDVKEGKWYYKAVTWALANKVTSGKSATLFGVGENVTREQLAQFLMNYATKRGFNTKDRADLSKFPDAASVSGWAKNAVSWANANGIINGKAKNGKNYLDPKGNATRAETAQMIMAFQRKFGK